MVCQLPTEPLSCQYPEQDSNLQTLADQRCASVPEPSRSAGWRIWACRQWSRMESNHRFLDVTQASSPLDHGTVFSVDSPGVAPGFPACGAGVFLLDHEPILSERKPWDSNPQVAVRPPVFKTGSSSGRMTSVHELRGLESNQHQGVQSAPSYR